jgi:integrase/recombinase XerD
LLDTTYIERYKAYLTDVRHASANTVASYIRDISKFAEYLQADGKSSIENATQKQIRSYIKYLQAENKSTATITRSIASLRAFFNHLADTGIITTSPAKDITIALATKKPPQFLTDQEIKQLLAQPDTKNIKGCRDKAMFEILYATGIRVSELINLEVADINLATGLVTCRNGKERIVPLHKAAVKTIEHYLLTARQKMAATDENALFINANGERLTRQGFWKILKKYTEKAQISGDVTPQMLRNSFAVHLLENGANIQTLKEMLGHTGISSTKVYAQAIEHELKDAYDKTHPRAKSGSIGQKS